MCARELIEKAREWKELVRPYLSDHRSLTHTLSRDRSALLVIDMQRYFLDSSSHAYVPASSEIIDNVRALISAYRQMSRPVVFTRHALLPDEDAGAMGRWWGDVLREGDPLSEIVEALRPLPGETVLRKSRYSAFAGTELENTLRELGVDQISITGVMTHLCCETTARDAFLRDFDVFFLIDGTASRSEELHVAALKTLADGFAIPATTEEVLRWLRA